MDLYPGRSGEVRHELRGTWDGEQTRRIQDIGRRTRGDWVRLADPAGILPWTGGLLGPRRVSRRGYLAQWGGTRCREGVGTGGGVWIVTGSPSCWTSWLGP